MPCHNCGRTFLPDRLAIHLKSCDKAHPKKTLVDEGSKSATTLGSSMSLSTAG